MPEASNGRGQLLKFCNCRLLRGHQIVIDDLWVRNGKILNPERLFYDEQTLADVTIDCNGLILAPGFIDVQINGKLIICLFCLLIFNTCYGKYKSLVNVSLCKCNVYCFGKCKSLAWIFTH